MTRSRNDLCDAGFPVPLGRDEPCPQCGAKDHECCKAYDHMTAHEVRENKRAYVAGREPPHSFK